MAGDRGLRETMGVRGRELASHFSAERTAEMTERAYRAGRLGRGRPERPGAG